MKQQINILNKKARYDYEIIDTYLAGIVLKGSEIKSIRGGKASIIDSHCAITNNEVWLYNSYIAHNCEGSHYDHEEHAARKLLLNRKEINYLFKQTQQKGYTIVPLKMFIAHGLCKLEIALAKGKKDYDKRESIKERDTKRELQRCIKNY